VKESMKVQDMKQDWCCRRGIRWWENLRFLRLLPAPSLSLWLIRWS